MASILLALGRDVGPLCLLVLTAIVWKKSFYMRGLTYRASVVPAGREKMMKSIFYLGLLGSVDAALRRIGQLFLVFPKTERSAFLLRLLCLHVPWAIWALRGPLSERGSTRDDRGWSDTVTRSRFWRIISAAFGHAQIVLSEEWRQLSPSEIRHWMDRHYVIGMHPHGLLPVGAILAGLTWAGGGLRGRTASGVELPEPENGGELLHQRWFRQMKLRAAVASGACGLFPGFYEMFTTLGAFECTKPFICDRLRAGRDVAIFVGGAQESAYATPGRYVCYVKCHKGFVRLALEERRDILPMWTFGDESIIPQIRNPPAWLTQLQHLFKSITGLLVPPGFAGIPQLPPLTMVTGVPISLEDLWAKEVGGEVSDEAVEEGHRRYLEAQRKLFDSNKALVRGGHEKGVIEFI
ncbi:mogat2-a [Symbiodinium sp. CCMP2456]|nr:mogat2-a [Symbiodinium sp. CCMP2456]